MQYKGKKIISEKGNEYQDYKPVSMNMWGFTPDIFNYLENSFEKFLIKNRTIENTEFLIPSVINDYIKTNDFKVKAIETNSFWFGVTFKEDKNYVIKNIMNLIKDKKYPSPLY